jgi:putative ABC transport system permease protein
VVILKSILSIALSNILKKKAQSIMLFIIITVSAVSFGSSIGVLASINSPFEKTFNDLKGPHDTFILDSKLYNSTEIRDWWKKNKSVEAVSDLIPCVVASSPYLNGKMLDSGFFLSEMVNSTKRINDLKIIEGSKSDSPKDNEIWIPTGIAYNKGMSVGDNIRITVPGGTKTFKISAIIVDPIFSSQMINPVRVWVASGTLQKIYPKEALNSSFLSVRYLDIKDSVKIWEEFESFIGAPFSGFKFSYEIISLSFTMLYQIIGIVLLIFSLILLFITLYIMFSTVSDAVLSDYKTIGTLKASGFTPFNIIWIYVSHIMLISVFAIPIGLLASTFVIKILSGSLMKILGIANTNLQVWTILISVFFIMMFVMGLSAFISSKKAGNVKAADAIRYGEPPQRFKNKRSGTKIYSSLPMGISLGINQIMAYKRQILFSFIIFFVTAFVTVLSINSLESIKKMSENRTEFGFDSSDIIVESKGTKFGVDNSKILSWLKSDSRVKDVLASSYISSGVIPKDFQNASMSIIGVCYDGDMSKMDLKTTDGKNPANDKEIALARNTSKKYNKKVGDTFNLYIEGKLLEFRVSGIYQGINNMGQGYRITYNAVLKANKEFEANEILVKFIDDTDITAFTADLKKGFGNGIDVTATEKAFKGIMDPIVSNMALAVLFVSIIFISVLIVTLVSSTTLFIHKNKKIFGIYKAIGVTPNQSRLSIIFKNLIITVIAGSLGILTSLLILPSVMSLMCQSMGVINFPFIINSLQTAAVLPLMMILNFISSYIPSGRILKINARVLTSE